MTVEDILAIMPGDYGVSLGDGRVYSKAWAVPDEHYSKKVSEVKVTANESALEILTEMAEETSSRLNLFTDGLVVVELKLKD